MKKSNIFKSVRSLLYVRGFFTTVAIAFLLAMHLLGSFARAGEALDTDSGFNAVVDQNQKRTLPEWHRTGKVPEGPQRGEEINTGDGRAGVILNGTNLEKDYKLNPGDILIGNIYHEQDHWVGIMRAGSVKSVSFVLEYFSSDQWTGHGMLRFKFSQPIELVSRISDTFNSPEIKLEKQPEPILLNDIFLSTGPIYTNNAEPFNFKRGLEGYYANANRFVSAQDRLLHYYKTGHRQQEWDLNYSQIESQRAFKQALVSSHVEGYTKMFNILFRNCIRCALTVGEKANGYVSRANFALEKAFYSLAWANSKLFPAEVFTGFSLMLRGLTDLQFKSKAKYFEDDPSVAEIKESVRDEIIEQMLESVLTGKRLEELEIRFGHEFVAELIAAKTRKNKIEKPKLDSKIKRETKETCRSLFLF